MAENGTKEKKKVKSRRSSKQDEAAPPVAEVLDEIKKFKENLLQSVSNGESILSSSEPPPPPPEFKRSRSRSASHARESLVVPPDVMAELDENKLYELKEAFLLFDLDGDGCIDHADLCATLVSLGDRVDENAVRGMLAEAPNPLDFDGFVHLLGYRTLDMDSEETLIDALSRWDKDNSGFISEERIRHDLMCFGDRFTEKEANYALDEAPTVVKGGQLMIDYVKFCGKLAGLRKSKRQQ
ncbi:hypothetical protein JYU34_004103 [Plutella xylostella]|uniref:EF-hand domain-containing protein n=1 Tax=Plutella xylostella TaxID=51655 RepID=A0ABQ7QX52_PLUXY|nr:hypothetical protein JYU34_004103 [Plutella xylostella]